MASRGAGRVAAAALIVAAVLVTAGLALRASLGGGIGAMARDWSFASATLPLSLGVVGALIVSRRPRNLVGWALVATAVTTALAGAARYYATRALGADPLPGGEWAAWLFTWLIEINVWVLALVMLVFPHDRPRGRARRVLVALALAAACLGALVAGLTPLTAPVEDYPFAGVPNPVAVLRGEAARVLQTLYYGGIQLAAYTTPIVVAIASLLRTRGVERQQWKTLAIGALGLVGLVAVAAVDESLVGVAAIVALPLVPLSIGLAILRHGLYDIDRLLSRTLAYAVLTALLGAVYAGSIVGLRVLVPVADSSDLAVAASTLLVAALFGPLRRRVQRSVDRRFHRARYDAARAAEAFGQRMRDQVDLGQVTSALHDTVVATVRPATVSLWLVRGTGAGQRGRP